MFTATATTMRNDPVDSLTRAELTARVEAVAEFEGAIAAYKLRLATAIDALPDEGLNARGVLRSHGRVSGKTAARIVETADGLAEMPKTREALDSGRITIEHATVLARAGQEVDPESADSELVGVAESGPADIVAKRVREWVGLRTKPDPKTDEQQHAARTFKRWDDNDTGLAMYLFGVS